MKNEIIKMMVPAVGESINEVTISINNSLSAIFLPNNS